MAKSIAARVCRRWDVRGDERGDDTRMIGQRGGGPDGCKDVQSITVLARPLLAPNQNTDQVVPKRDR
jgi:hypothetical protein